MASSLRGLRRTVRRVRAVPSAMREARAETLDKWADNVLGSAKKSVPERTGKLKSDLDKKVEHNDGYALVGVWNPAALEYALYVEKGTSSMKAQPYLVPAFDEHRRNVVRTYRNKLRQKLGAIS